jgi:hypothetical protein
MAELERPAARRHMASKSTSALRALRQALAVAATRDCGDNAHQLRSPDVIVGFRALSP